MAFLITKVIYCVDHGEGPGLFGPSQQGGQIVVNLRHQGRPTKYTDPGVKEVCGQILRGKGTGRADTVDKESLFGLEVESFAT